MGLAGILRPHFQYDRSGRSTGVGVVIFTTANEAEHAKSQMQGVVLKGEAIEIKYERFFERAKKGAPSSNDPSSLLNRIGKPPLKDRITDPGADGDVAMTDSSGPGPIRTKGQRPSRGAPRGGRPPRAKNPAKSANDLDKELDKYAGTTAESKSGGDVEMAT